MKRQKIFYWFVTVVLALGLLGTGIQQVLRVEAVGAYGPPFAWGIAQLGYPVYILTILGTWKILGAVTILIPKYPLLKEWAYAGIFFLLTGALFSHAASGHPWFESIAAITLLTLAILSWYFRPADRNCSVAQPKIDYSVCPVHQYLGVWPGPLCPASIVLIQSCQLRSN